MRAVLATDRAGVVTPKREYVVHMESIGELETGLWCDRCLKPSVARLTMAMTHESRILHIGTMERCTDCPEECISSDDL